jgi:hypothetical protein
VTCMSRNTVVDLGAAASHGKVDDTASACHAVHSRLFPENVSSSVSCLYVLAFHHITATRFSNCMELSDRHRRRRALLLAVQSMNCVELHISLAAC